MSGGISFIGKASGDGESFCWDDVKTEDMVNIVGAEQYARDTADQWNTHRLYPGAVLAAAGIEPGKEYLFTITAVEVL